MAIPPVDTTPWTGFLQGLAGEQWQSLQAELAAVRMRFHGLPPFVIALINSPSEAGGGTPAPGQAIQVAGHDDSAPSQLRPLLTDHNGVLAVSFPPNVMFSQQNAPAAATQATTVLAASVAGVRHVCVSALFVASMAAAAMPIQDATLLDGAAVLATVSLNCPANDTRSVLVKGPFRGTAATSMTAQFAAAPPAGGFQRVYLCGYDISEP